MSVVNTTWKTLMASVILAAPAAAQPVPPVPPMPPAPMIAPMLPAPPMVPLLPGLIEFEMPEMPEIPEIPEIPALPDLSFVGPLVAGALAEIGPIGPGPMGPGPIGPGPLGFGPVIAGGDQDRAAEARQRADEARQREEEAKQREAERRQRIDERYQRGQEYLERRNWARAVDSFTSVIESDNSSRIDAALYWKAYALDKLNQQTDALAALQDMIKRFPQSRWLSDAKALELQVRAPECRPGAASGSGVG
jgi:tetratricopeptide (TPR) repeat protein